VDDGHLAYYFIVLAVFMLLSLVGHTDISDSVVCVISDLSLCMLQVYLIYISSGYEYKTRDELDIEFTESETSSNSMILDSKRRNPSLSSTAHNDPSKAKSSSFNGSVGTNGNRNTKQPKKRDSDSSQSSNASFTNVTDPSHYVRPSPLSSKLLLSNNQHDDFMNIQEGGDGNDDDGNNTDEANLLADRFQRSDTITSIASSSRATISTQMVAGSLVVSRGNRIRTATGDSIRDEDGFEDDDNNDGLYYREGEEVEEEYLVDSTAPKALSAAIAGPKSHGK
jgi:hypothetical protein